MNKTEVMAALKKAGNERHRTTYARHGITSASKALGVPYSELYKLQKAIKKDQKVAEQLWSTGVHDARVLATLIADPAAISAATLDAWAKTINNQLSGDAVAQLAARSPHATRCMTRWIEARREWLAAAGWHLLAAMAGRPEIDLDDDDLAALVDRIEREIHDGPNRVRYSMNGALIAIGIRGGALQTRALAAARRIGKVHVDHGDTACKTPDAAAYIKKAVEHRRRKKQQKKKASPARRAANARA